MQSEHINELAQALAAAQGQIKNPERNCEVTVTTRTGHKYKFKYADHAAIIDAVKKPLSDNGIGYIQYVEQIDEKFRLVTQLMHSSGQWVSAVNPLFLTPQKDKDGNALPPSSQDFGSALTYMKRYALAAMAGVAADSDDDDANLADGYTATPINKVFGPIRTQEQIFPKSPKVEPPTPAAAALVDIAAASAEPGSTEISTEPGKAEMSGQAWRRFSEKAIEHARKGGAFTPEQQQKMSLMKVQAPKTWQKMADAIADAQMTVNAKASAEAEKMSKGPDQPKPEDDPDAYRVWFIDQMSRIEKKGDLKDFFDIQRPLWTPCFPPDIEDWEALYSERSSELS